LLRTIRRIERPRFDPFAALYGLGNTIAMIDGALARSAKGAV
jgi:hypothetical protein